MDSEETHCSSVFTRSQRLTCVFFCLERETVLYNRVQEVSLKIITLAHCFKAMLA
jgi:hypothetical protein